MSGDLRARAMRLELAELVQIDNQARVEMTVRCRDCEAIPKVPEAGHVLMENDTRVQVMHNGLRVVADGYYGAWTTEIIERCRGHHEPQEEAVFHALLQHIPPPATMIEIGGFWAYYSLWFLKDAPERRAIVIEPDPAHLDIGRQNAALNHCMIEFVQGFVGGEGPEISPFATEVSGTIELPRIDVTTLLAKRNIAYLDILHCDAQGAEFDVLLSCAELLAARRIGFIVVSTHIFPGLADPLLHQRCLWLVKELGGEVLAEHDVHESFSADGLIVAYFGAGKIDWKPPAISYNRYSSSFFRNPLYDLSLMRAALATSEQDRAARLEVIERLDAEVQVLRSRLEISEQDRAARREVIQCLDANLQLLQAELEARKHPWKTWARSSARTLKRAVLKHSRKQD